MFDVTAQIYTLLAIPAGLKDLHASLTSFAACATRFFVFLLNVLITDSGRSVEIHIEQHSMQI